MARLPERVGTYYRGGQGQWSWALHRITGVAVALFLFVHILDTSLIAAGPKVYDKIIGTYHNPIFRLLEIGLAVAVLYHALNVLRIILIDFVPRMADYSKELFRASMGLFIVLVVPALYFMGRTFVRSL
ncbi:MAG: succinate dehydrogenase, cytochrome b556 subunit [Actinomycetota bacterium]